MRIPYTTLLYVKPLKYIYFKFGPHNLCINYNMTYVLYNKKLFLARILNLTNYIL